MADEDTPNLTPTYPTPEATSRNPQPAHQRRTRLTKEPSRPFTQLPQPTEPGVAGSWRKTLADQLAVQRTAKLPTPIRILFYVNQDGQRISLTNWEGVDQADLRRLSQPDLIPAFQLGDTLALELTTGATVSFKIINKTVCLIRNEPHVLYFMNPVSV